MKRLLILIFVLAACSTEAMSQDGVCRTESGIAYRAAGGDRQIDSMCRLDICWPAGKTGFPTVVWYHGGGLTGGRRTIPEGLKNK